MRMITINLNFQTYLTTPEGGNLSFYQFRLVKPTNNLKNGLTSFQVLVFRIVLNLILNGPDLGEINGHVAHARFQGKDTLAAQTPARTHSHNITPTRPPTVTNTQADD